MRILARFATEQSLLDARPMRIHAVVVSLLVSLGVVACESASEEPLASVGSPLLVAPAADTATEVAAPAEHVCRCHCDVSVSVPNPFDPKLPPGSVTTRGCATKPTGATCDENYDLDDTLNCGGNNGGSCEGFWPPAEGHVRSDDDPAPGTPEHGTLSGCGRTVIAKPTTAIEATSVDQP